MPGKLRNRLLAFIESDKDVPLLAGFAVGFYMMLFYYSKNLALANSWQQLLFFTEYYLVLPTISLFIGSRLLGFFKLTAYKKHFLFVGAIGFFAFFLLQLSALGETKRIVFAAVLVIATVLSLKISRYYKAFIPILFLISLFNIQPVAEVAYNSIAASGEWKKMPDSIEAVKFVEKPNVYYIQPDGYTSFKNLRENPHYDIDNSDYENFLKSNGFTLYDNFRSNYYSTLLSNSATFSMKHHYIAKDVEKYGARSIIAGNNPVVRIFKNNGYKTSFLTEQAYLLMNRPKMGYDYCNIKPEELPYLKDGWGLDKNVLSDLKTQMKANGPTGNFYFLESFVPGHIISAKSKSAGIKGEKKRYLSKLGKANEWLKEIIGYINANDPDAIIIIGADHGGFTGFYCTRDSHTKVTDRNLIHSIFGAQLAIKWRSSDSKKYDTELKTGVNLFRTVFSFLSRDKKYFRYLENNGSYIKLKNPSGVYRYIDDSGKTVFEAI